MSRLDGTTLGYIDALKAELHKRRDALAAPIARGGLETLADYKLAGGMVRGIEEAIAMIERVYDEWNR